MLRFCSRSSRLVFVAMILTVAADLGWTDEALTSSAETNSLASFSPLVQNFLKEHCIECHRTGNQEGDLNFESLAFDLNLDTSSATWVLIHDRIDKREMPPPDAQASLDSEHRQTFLDELATRLTHAHTERVAREGRATWRRMNRYEYENTLRDLLGAPWLQIKDMLPEDGEAFRFNKIGEALDVSHVQISRYLTAAEYALAEAIQAQSLPAPRNVRYYAREQPAFARRIHFTQFNRSPERATFPIKDNEADLVALSEAGPITVGEKDPDLREREAVGVVASSYEPIEIKFDGFKAPASGRYQLRVCAHSFWAHPESDERWWRPSREKISAGRTREPLSLYAETPPRLLRKLGSFDVSPDPATYELESYLLEGETIRPDAVRLFRSRPPGGWHNPLAEKDGQPGVAFRWLEVEGPFPEPTRDGTRRLLFGELPCTSLSDGKLEVHPKDVTGDSRRLLRSFMRRAYGRPPTTVDLEHFHRVVIQAHHSGSSFAEAMLAGYAAILCSPQFVTLEERPGLLDDAALAARLSYFLWNSEPDQRLRQLASKKQLGDERVLRQETERLLQDPKVNRFIEAFLDYWLDLRKANATSPDAELYPDYYLDDFLVESACDESRAFMKELIQNDLPARSIVDSDFVMVNERLAQHYQLPKVEGVNLRRVSLPADSSRGGFLTQASVLKVTANGTTTSPVLRGVWIMERILGETIPPPPSAVPAVEPDTRGATTIRQLLAKHRTLETCNACHAKIDPAGFALESFDVLGGFRQHYRAISSGASAKPKGYGKNGQPFGFIDGPPVDPSGELSDGRRFQSMEDLKRLLLENERQIAKNLAHQLIVYSTGAAVKFGDRPKVEQLLNLAQPSHYGVKSLIVEIIQSDLFRYK